MTKNKEPKQSFLYFKKKINEIVSRTVVKACFLIFEFKKKNNGQLLHHLTLCGCRSIEFALGGTRVA